MIRENDDGSFDVETFDDLREVLRRYREQHPRDVVPRRPCDNGDLEAFEQPMTKPDPAGGEFASAFSPAPGEQSDDTDTPVPEPEGDPEPADEVVGGDDPDPDEADDQPDDDLAKLISDPTVYEAMMQCAEDSDGEPDESADLDSEPSSRREARYRTELRETQQRLGEAESFIGELQGRVERMQRADIERAAAARLVDGADIWIGASLDDMLDKAGDVDQAKVGQVLDRLLLARPHWAHPMTRPQARYRMPISGASNPPEEPRTSSWVGAFGPPRRD